MRPIVTDRVAWSVRRSVTVASPAKTGEPIKMSFGLRTRMGPGKHRWGAHWRNLVNTIKPSMCDGDAACCQITFTTCLLSCTGTFKMENSEEEHAYAVLVIFLTNCD